MFKGGYQIVDLRGTNLTADSPATIPGVGKALLGSNNKRTVVSGLVVSDAAQTDHEVLFTESSGTYTGEFGTWTITINSANDQVTVSVTE